MNSAAQLAKHLRELNFGGNWTTTNLKDTLADINWKEATTQVYSFNTIATLTFHIHYFVNAVLPVFQGGKLDAHDKYSFDHPAIHSAEDWQKMQNLMWEDVGKLADFIEKIPDEKLYEDFTDKKYGSYYRNLLGIIEHAHYHLGQIVLIKKIIRAGYTTG